ncbi:MAG TPA: hypothetical protein VJ919_05580, partial [Tangfeifania sp.]|nr:hypothetical protein [Tangfeifania sp.]
MNYKILFIPLFFLFATCNSSPTNAEEELQVIYQPEDKEILEQVLEMFSEETKTPTPVLMVKS